MKFLVLLSACVAAASAIELVTYPNGAVAPAKTPEVKAAEVAHFAAKGAFLPYAYSAGFPYNAGVYSTAAATFPQVGAYGHATTFPQFGAYANGAYTNGVYANGAAFTYPGTYANGAAIAYPGAYANGAAIAHPGAYAHGAAFPHLGATYNTLPYAFGTTYNGLVAGARPLVAHPNGAIVPVDEPAVQAAKAQHFAAKEGSFLAATAPIGYAAGFAGLVAHPNGALVPAEPADVVAARAEHLSHHA